MHSSKALALQGGVVEKEEEKNAYFWHFFVLPWWESGQGALLG